MYVNRSSTVPDNEKNEKTGSTALTSSMFDKFDPRTSAITSIAPHTTTTPET